MRDPANSKCLTPRPVRGGRGSLCAHALLALLCAAAIPSTAKAAGSTEWLASTEGPSPTVTSKSGSGTVNATAEAKITADGLQTWCTEQEGGDPAAARAQINACVKREQGQIGKSYRIAADCTVGRLQALDGKGYLLDGLWDNSDVGAGRTRWRGPDGAVVGRDSASGGLALSQQWEVLCPGRVSAAVLSKARALGTSGTGGAQAQAAPVAVCGGDPSCTEVNGFAMSVVEFRASLQGAWKILTTTLRFRNKLSRPIVLGYVVGSGGATDDRGNRYMVKDSEVRGIGFILPGRNDDKFQIAPGQTGDARFMLVWSGQALFGNTFDLDLTVREIVPAGNGQSTLGPEYPLQIVGLVDGARAANPAVAQASGPGSSGAAPQPAMDTPQTSGGAAPAQGGTPSSFGAPAAAGGAPATGAAPHCAAGSSCHDAGAFSVTVMQAATAVSGKNQLVRLSVRVKNHTGQPLALGYKAGTSNAVDEQGASYTWGRPGTHDASAQGIGTLEGTRIDPQFQIAPGATRDAQLILTRFDAGPRPPGRTFTLDTVLVELRGSGMQWQRVREYAVHVAPAGSGVVPAVGQNPAGDGVQKASDLLRGLLGGK